MDFKWHDCRHISGNPAADGEYICKCYDIEYLGKCDEDTIWTEPFFAVAEFVDGFWDIDGVVVAWASIPECNVEIGGN